MKETVNPLGSLGDIKGSKEYGQSHDEGQSYIVYGKEADQSQLVQNLIDAARSNVIRNRQRKLMAFAHKAINPELYPSPAGETEDADS